MYVVDKAIGWTQLNGPGIPAIREENLFSKNLMYMRGIPDNIITHFWTAQLYFIKTVTLKAHIGDIGSFLPDIS